MHRLDWTNQQVLFYLRFESGGQSGRTSIGFPALCTVGAAELASPPVSGSTALFSTAIESAFFSSALPVVTDEVVQFVSGFKFGDDVDCAPAGPAIKATLSTATSIRITFSLTKPFTVSGKNVPSEFHQFEIFAIDAVRSVSGHDYSSHRDNHHGQGGEHDTNQFQSALVCHRELPFNTEKNPAGVPARAFPSLW
ncbi:hypothetical protein [Bradyrhizobium sp. sGM-13]|uniref:hypothetical protein n=1 Tax=Bradyrhizobium sp. sGM-13 TaxID=2831781 RepID=UPI001BD0BFBF|nr:hypothetical protein [Bradyrhizobium sp. sGM-13]